MTEVAYRNDIEITTEIKLCHEQMYFLMYPTHSYRTWSYHSGLNPETIWFQPCRFHRRVTTESSFGKPVPLRDTPGGRQDHERDPMRYTHSDNTCYLRTRLERMFSSRASKHLHIYIKCSCSSTFATHLVYRVSNTQALAFAFQSIAQCIQRAGEYVVFNVQCGLHLICMYSGSEERSLEFLNKLYFDLCVVPFLPAVQVTVFTIMYSTLLENLHSSTSHVVSQEDESALVWLQVKVEHHFPMHRVSQPLRSE
jgi:hypothetical protein